MIAQRSGKQRARGARAPCKASGGLPAGERERDQAAIAKNCKGSGRGEQASGRTNSPRASLPPFPGLSPLPAGLPAASPASALSHPPARRRCSSLPAP